MNIKQLMSVYVGGCLLILVFPSSMARATNDLSQLPHLGTCPDPGGTIIASYDEGKHQIPGGELGEGSDYVYEVDDKIFVQCFCPKEGKTGIQSNWLHESQVTSEQKEILLRHGWMTIEHGTDWGLPDGTYLVKNRDFFCKHDNCDQKDDHKEDVFSYVRHKENNYLVKISSLIEHQKDLKEKMHMISKQLTSIISYDWED